MCLNLLGRLLLKAQSRKPLQFLRTNGGILRISTAVLKQIDAERQTTARACESGGVMLGRIINERPDIAVDAVTRPPNAYRRSRYAFHRAEHPTQSLIARAWRASRGE